MKDDTPHAASSSPEEYSEPPSVLRQPGALITWIVASLAVAAVGWLVISATGRVSDCGGQSLDRSNIRQIAQASLIYALDNHDELPQTDDIHAFAFELARVGGLNDASIWFSRFDSAAHPAADAVVNVLNRERTALEPNFAAARPSYTAVVRGLKVSHPSTTPIAWTRGLQPDGTWAKDSPYGGDGGYIVFLGGNVAFHRDLKRDPLTRFDGAGNTSDIRAALPPDAVIDG